MAKKVKLSNDPPDVSPSFAGQIPRSCCISCPILQWIGGKISMKQKTAWWFQTLSLWKIWVSWDDDIPFPRWWESHNPANNPAMFQSPPTRISCHIKSQYIPILIQYCSSYTPNKFFRCGPQEVNSAPWNHQPANQLHQFPLSFPFDQSMESWPSPSNTPTWARLWPAPTQHSAGGLEIPWNGWIPDLSWSKYPLVN